MIVVKTELHSAITGKVSEIGRVYIANDGTGTADKGNYDVYVCRRGNANPPAGLSKHPAAIKAARTGKVTDYPRNDYNVHRLIARALVAAFPEEKAPRPTFTHAVLDHDVMKGLAKFVEQAMQYAPVDPDTKVEDALTQEQLKALQWLLPDAADRIAEHVETPA